jgi:hypothetical protein
LLPKKNKDFLAHPGFKKAPEYSNMFIGTVYIKGLSIYAHLVGFNQDPGSTDGK